MDTKRVFIAAILVSVLMVTQASFLSSGASTEVSWTGDTTITSSGTYSNQSYSATEEGHNSLLVSGDITVTLTNPTVTRTGGGSAEDEANFYGTNAAVMVKGGAQVTITGGTITSSAKGANGVFSYGGNGDDGTTVTISGVTIETSGTGSGGIMTTGGGTTVASDLTITTTGGSSAPIRSDRGGGTVTVDGGTYTSSGEGSPAVYSTAEITVSNATLTANASEGIVVEGENSVTLNDCVVTSNHQQTVNSYYCAGVMIYQSGSGDADDGTSYFTAEGGSITAQNGHLIHVTNTNTVISLTDVDLVNSDDGIVLSVCDNHWGTGNNSATVTASDQVLEGQIVVGDNSSLVLKLTNGSAFTGTITEVSVDTTNENYTATGDAAGIGSVTLDSTSTWTLSADTYIASFSGTAANVYANGYTLYVAGSALSGTSSGTPSGSSDSGSGDSGSSDSGSGDSGSDDTSTDDNTSDDTGSSSGSGGNDLVLPAVGIAAVCIILVGAFAFLKMRKP